MDLAVRDVVSQASQKLTTILRTRRFHGGSKLVQVYKSKVLSFVEYRNPAVYHAAKTTLAGIDAVQRLETRRDIAMLGLIHRSVLGCARGTLRTCFCPLRRGLPRNMTNNTREPSSFANFVTLCIGTR